MTALRRPLGAFVACLALIVAASGFASPATAAESAVTGSNVVLAPTSGSRVRDKLVVFLPGTGYTPGNSREYLETAADLGFHTIGLAYVNGISANKACRDVSSDCFGSFRHEIIYGDDVSPQVKVSKADSIVRRLKGQLTTSGFGQFLTDGGIDWSKVILTGHSQGAGHVAFLGLKQRVARVVMLGGPNDLYKSSLPSWIKQSSTTIPANWYGLTAQLDNSLGTQMKAWDVFGLTKAADKREVPTGAPRLVTTLKAADNRDHESVVVDKFLLRQEGVPRLVPSWQYLLGDGEAAGAFTTTADDDSAGVNSPSSTATPTPPPDPLTSVPA